jgi:hypothetical protein
MPKTKKIEIVNKKGKVTDIVIKKKKTRAKLPPLHPKIKGRGDYTISDIAKTISKPFTDTTESKGFVNKAARFAGSTLGSMTGIPGVGEALGNASSWLARIMGFGDYTLRRNSFMTNYTETVPQFRDNGGLTFAHREYIMDITSSTTFNNQGFLINAGNPLLFPWLSRLASNYEEYEFLGLVFEFRTTSATAVGSTNTGLGTLIMATDYDCIDTNYPNKQAMEIADFATSSAPCYNQIHPIECDPRKNVMRKYFVQNATTLAGYPDDPRFSVLGNFQIATSGVQAASTVGELWVTYHVKLSKPQIASLSTIQTQPFVHYQFTSVNASTTTVVNSSSYPNNGGLTLTPNPSWVDIACANSLGAGSYLIVAKSVNVAAGGSITTFPTNVAVLFNGASFTGTSLTPVSDSSYATAYGNASNSVLTNHLGVPTAISRPGVVVMAIVNLPLVNSSVRVFLCNDASNTIQNDIYITPYASANLSKPPSEKAQMKAKLDEVCRLIEQMQSPNPPGNTVNVRVPSLSDIDDDQHTRVIIGEEMRRPERRPPCIDTSNRLPLTPIDEYRYVEVVRSEPTSKDTSQLQRK